MGHVKTDPFGTGQVGSCQVGIGVLIPFLQEWNDSIPFQLQWNDSTPFQPEWNEQSIPAGLE